METLEQKARDILERMGIEDAQSMTAGDVLELANLLNRLKVAEAVCRIADRYDFRNLAEALDNWRKVRKE